MIQLILLTIRYFLAAVFVLSFVTKIYDIQNSLVAFRNFGLPNIFRQIVLTGVLVSEVVIAFCFVFNIYVLETALFASLLLVVFSGFLWLQFKKNKNLSCPCFGSLSANSISWQTFLRNAGLFALSSILFLAQWNNGAYKLSVEADSANPIPNTTESVIVFLLLLLLAFSILAINTLSRLNNKVEQFRARSERMQAHTFELRNVYGDVVTLERLLSQKNVLLIFILDGCDACDEVLSSVESWQLNYRDQLLPVIVGVGSQEVVQSKAQNYQMEHVLIDEDEKVSHLYGINAFPSAVFIDQGGTLVGTSGINASFFEVIVQDWLHYVSNIKP